MEGYSGMGKVRVLCKLGDREMVGMEEMGKPSCGHKHKGSQQGVRSMTVLPWKKKAVTGNWEPCPLACTQCS